MGVHTNTKDQMSPRARFASDLEHYRKKAKLSQISLSSRMRCHTSLISHVERGRRTPTLEFAEAADRAFELDGHFVHLYRQISQSPALGWFARWAEEIEPQAVILQSWDPLLVPGLLQTPEYARAIFSTTSPPEPASLPAKTVAAPANHHPAGARGGWMCSRNDQRIHARPSTRRH
jgi:transcriptional regulator with XRE-family HTH domain